MQSAQRREYLDALGVTVYQQRGHEPLPAMVCFRLSLQGSQATALLFCEPLSVEANTLFEKMMAAAGFELEPLEAKPDPTDAKLLVMGDLQIGDQQTNIAHPELLLQQPELKREAWEALKSVVKSLKA